MKNLRAVHTTDKVQRFCLKQRQWSIFSRYVSPVFFPFAENGLSCTALQNKLFIFGGQTVRVDSLDLESGEWRRENDMKVRVSDLLN